MNRQEMGEANKAALDGDRTDFRHELIQVAAVVVAMLEEYDEATESATKGETKEGMA